MKRDARKTAAVLGWAAMAGWWGLAGWGCSAPVRSGESPTAAGEYFLGTLRADVDPRIDVLTAAAATESALLTRGYVIVGRTASGDMASFRARQARGLETVRAEITHAPAGTRIALTVEPFGDEVASRVIMEAILVRLPPPLPLPPTAPGEAASAE